LNNYVRCVTNNGGESVTEDRRILVLDPDERSRDLLRRVLGRLSRRVDTVATAAELRARVDEPLELVVLEVDLPDANGYELCRELHETHGDDLPVIFVSGRRTEPADRVAGLLLGADDYVVKPFDPDELLARVRRSLRRSGAVPTQASVHRPTSLTHREQEVLTLLAAGRTQKEIGTELVISAKTVGTHIQRILAKLGVHSRAQAVALALREGLVSAGDMRRETRGRVVPADAVSS
jgi:DNA-binding NarL/FixJ family response regulator